MHADDDNLHSELDDINTASDRMPTIHACCTVKVELGKKEMRMPTLKLRIKVSKVLTIEALHFTFQ